MEKQYEDLEVRFGKSVLKVPQTSQVFLLTGGMEGAPLSDCILDRYKVVLRSERVDTSDLTNEEVAEILATDIKEKGNGYVLGELYEAGVSILGSEVVHFQGEETPERFTGRIYGKDKPLDKSEESEIDVEDR